MPESKETDKSRGDVRKGSSVGEMHARREKMADGRRYMIYYTFGDVGVETPETSKGETPRNV